MNQPVMLADINRRGIRPSKDASEQERQMSIGFLETLQSATVFVVDNVAQYLHGKGEFDPNTDLPNVAPPFDIFWMEYNSHKDIGDPDPMRVGALFRAFDMGDPEQATDRAQGVFDKLTGSNRPIYGDEKFGRLIDPVRWILAVEIALKLDNTMAFGPVKHWFGAVTPDGRFARTDEGLANVANLYGPDELFTDDYLSAIRGSLAPAFLALSFMHCKNVAQEERLPSRQERRECERRGEPVVKYRTLQIEPMRKVLATEGGVAHNGIKKALHICRGHFSHYSEEKPLFGKYSGQFWIPAHVRGTAEAGKVVKDYAVKAPRQAA